MGSPLSFFACIGSMNPPPTPPEEGSQCQGTLAEFPSWEGPGVGRLMERSHGFPTAPRGHEPPPHLTSGHPPHQLGGTSDIEHPTPNIEWQRDPSLTSAFGVRCWTFDVSPRFRGFNARIFISSNSLPHRGKG